MEEKCHDPTYIYRENAVQFNEQNIYILGGKYG